MQSCRTMSGNRQNSKERQTRAVVNLRQLSENTWMLQVYDQSTQQQSPSDELIHQTVQSAELPLNPKQNHNHTPKRQFISNPKPKPRPSTIQHQSLRTTIQTQHKVKPHPFTSINFYLNQSSQQHRSISDASSKLNQDLEMFASRIKQEGEKMQSIESGRTKSSAYKNGNSSFSFKSNVAKKSYFYKQVKNYLYESFKVDGKPVEIKINPYSMDQHGLPKRKSIYSFMQQNVDNKQKTQLLLKKVQRYQFEDEKAPIRLRNSSKIKSTSLYDSSVLRYAHQTLHMREKNDKNKPVGRLCLGRAPTKLLIQGSDT